MRVAVAGGTGLVGQQVADALRADGHEPVVISRAGGIDLVRADGLREKLEGVDSVIDVTNTPALQSDAAEAFFGAVTRNLLAVGRAAGVQHHVVLSILGLERVAGNGHYAGKRLQERLARQADIPATVVRAAQFFDFAAMVVRWTLQGDRAVVPPLLIQPLAVADLAEVLTAVATGEPASVTTEVAGPEPLDLVDMARRTLTARGRSLTLVPSWRGPFQAEMAGEVLLPGPGAQLTPTSFEHWLAGLTRASAHEGG
jgi:uncharacterized protein YbjT (DUF2867 family)